MEQFALHVYLSRNIFSLESSAHAPYSRILVECRFMIIFEQNITRVFMNAKLLEVIKHIGQFLFLFQLLVLQQNTNKNICLYNLVHRSLECVLLSCNTGRFIMFSVITNIYNKKTKRPTLMELFTATGKLKKFFFDN